MQMQGKQCLYALTQLNWLRIWILLNLNKASKEKIETDVRMGVYTLTEDLWNIKNLFYLDNKYK